MGGYNKGSGRSKHGYYKSIYCGSTYELCWVIYSLDHNIKFTRFPGALEQDGKKYFPDFLLDDGKTIIETKGYEKQESVDIKTQIAENLGYVVQVLRKDDLKFAFDYVRDRYKTSKFYTLYDEYKPEYSYLCSNCKDLFSRDQIKITVDKFCSRKCAGLFRKTTKQESMVPIKIAAKRKLTKDEALSIFNDFETSYSILAEQYSITKGSVSLIKNKSIYRWIHI